MGRRGNAVSAADEWLMEFLTPSQWLNYARGNRLRILMYHSISDTPNDRLAVSPASFAAQMRYLAENHFRVVSLREGCLKLQASASLKRTIVLTFDDGYRDFLTTAVPVLKQRAFPATLFVATNQINRSERFLTTNDLHRVRSIGFTIGSHTMTHPDLTNLDDRTLAHELNESRTLIAESGGTFFSFAYPGGTFTRRERDAVMHAGYDCALIVGGRWGNGSETDRFLLKREPMLATDTLARFKQRVDGFYEFQYLVARARGENIR